MNNSKYDAVTVLYRRTIDKIKASPQEWQNFIKSNAVAYNYKLPFCEKILLYAQRPNAKAVLEMQQWNKSFNRVVARGVKGIAIYNSNIAQRYLKYYFDVSDTLPTANSIDVPIWEVDSANYNIITDYFHNNYDYNDDITVTIQNAVNSLSTDIIDDYLENNHDVFSNYSKDNLKVSLHELVDNTSSLLITERLGINKNDFYDNDFDFISTCNRDEVIFVGNIVTNVTSEILSDISRLVLLDRRKSYENSKGQGQWSNLHSTRGLSSTKSSNRNETGTREVRRDEVQVSEREQGSQVLESVNIRQTERTSTENSRPSKSESGTLSQTDGERGTSDRGTENERPNEVGSIDEQHQEQSRGSSGEGNSLQLTETIKPLIEYDEQINSIEQEAEEQKKSSAFSFTQNDNDIPEEVITSIIQYGGSIENSKFRIYEQFQKSLSKKENADFLKDEYGSGGVYPFAVTSTYSSYLDFDSRGIHIDYEPDDGNRISVTLKWNEVEKRVSELILTDKYLSPNEMDKYVEKTLADKIKTENKKNITKNKDYSFDYQLLDRLRSDCRYYLDGHRNPDLLWAGSVEDQIKEMRKLYNSFPSDKKPQWITEEDINHFEAEMLKDNNINIDLEDYVGKEITIDERLFTIENINNNKVELRDITNPSSVPIFRFESTEFIKHILDNNSVEYEYSYKQGDIVHINSMDFVVRSVNDDSIVIADVNYPLMVQSFSKSDFEDKLSLSTSNDFLKQVKNSENEVVESESVDKLSTVEPTDAKTEIVSDIKTTVVTSEKYNFDYSTVSIPTGKKEKYLNNINAIKKLKELDKENRLATPEEQEILGKYVGWGGLSEAFDKNNSSWTNEYNELSSLLSPDEYSSARESTLSAFYTPSTVTKAIYKVLDKMGFKSGNILEPSCGVGNFIGMLPTEMSNSNVYGVELDTISSSIAKQLYQKAHIINSPYEDTDLPNNFFDVTIGNVPFGDFKVVDKKYDKYNFLIHDYFFAKSLDKLRPNGVMAFITSKGTMDKKNSSFRRYLSQRADLLGAIRLHNHTFSSLAGTEVTSDILFFKKRSNVTHIEPSWVNVTTFEDGISLNNYFVENPNMIIGEMKNVSGRFGLTSECVLDDKEQFEELLNNAINNINVSGITFDDNVIDIDSNDDTEEVIPATADVKNFSYAIVDDKIYYRENSLMTLQQLGEVPTKRVKGLVDIRDCLRTLIEYESEDYSDGEIKYQQNKLNVLYDNFTKDYGAITSRANRLAFEKDSSYYLLSSLENLDKNKVVHKADIFTKRTIRPHKPVTSVDTSVEALTVSISEKATIDMEYMQELVGKTEEEIYDDLRGVIFLNPLFDENNGADKYINADEYLSGNVREKLAVATKLAENNPEYNINVMALKDVQPEELSASEISVRLGSTWIPPKYVEQFVHELMETPFYAKGIIKVNYISVTGEWNIQGKSSDRSNVKAYKTYGTSRVNGYKIIEDTLNLKDVRIFDYVELPDGKKKAILNKKETTIAQSKQETIKQKFVDWIFKDPTRRNDLCEIYNKRFNSNRTREYDGSHINFVGMNPDITLKEHQINAVARILYGGNTLLAHTVGAGKTFEMVAASQESKRLGLCTKSMFVVPNYLTEQWAKEYLQLYPSANILVATKKDFQTKNRKRFCSRIATGDYDAIIIGHSQFEKIPVSIERQRSILEEQLNDVLVGIQEAKSKIGDNITVKALERTKKGIENKLKKLNDQSRKDDVITFEELGVDRLFVDESHYYKNLFLYTKMRNVGGIAQTEAQKSSDMFMKCRYMDEVTGGKGIIFATGTPISNSMVELYTIQRYLQYNTLAENHLLHFDEWASTFGETVTAIELNPEGSGYRAKTRFAKFYNLPELMTMFKEVADIQTADMLKLPVPKANYHNVVVKPSEMQIRMVEALSERADKVRNNEVDPTVDNMLKITNDGRKLALDQRLIDDTLDDFPESKVNVCANNVFKIWQDGVPKKTTQLIFCDLSTPSKDKFNVYDDIKNKLIDKGVPEEEIAFIHDAKTENQKAELFEKVRNGDVRVLFGSTQKMGAGTNVQDKIIASHDLDCPWRPSDLEQRLGRTVRQGNTNEEVEIYRYVTEKTFDAYLYQLVEGKQKFASQIMTSKSPARIAEDIDETALSYAEIKMLATGNPYIKEKMDLDIQVQKLDLLKSSFNSVKYELEDKIIKYYPQKILETETVIEGLKADIKIANSNKSDKFTGLVLNGQMYSDKKEAGTQLLEVTKKIKSPKPTKIGEYRGFDVLCVYDIWERQPYLKLKNNLSHHLELGSDTFGNITRLDNCLNNLTKLLDNNVAKLDNVKNQLENAKEEVKKPFAQEEELKTKKARLYELNSMLNLDDTNRTEKKETPYYKEVFTEEDKDNLIANGFDNYVQKEDSYIFKVDISDKDKIENILSSPSQKMCI